MAETVTRHQPISQISVADYLAQERESPVKREYVNGEFYAFAGATERHNRVAGNVFGLLWTRARHGLCRVFMSDIQLEAAPRVFYYPDGMVVCDDADDDPLIKRRPCLLVEVLSPGTARIERHEKLLAYQAIDSLRAYLIVDPEMRRVTRFLRDDNAAWQRADIIGDGEVAVPCPETTLALADVFEGIE
jgi:Uma2 family endonuclease